MRITYAPQPYEQPRRIMLLDGLNACALTVVLACGAVGALTIVVHLLSFGFLSLVTPSWECLHHQLWGCPNGYNGFWANITSYPWFMGVAVVGVIVFGAVAWYAARLSDRTDSAAKAAHEARVAAGRTMAVAAAQSKPWRLHDMWVEPAQFRGETCLMAHIRFGGPDDRAEGREPEEVILPAAWVRWIPSRDKEAVVFFPACTMTGCGDEAQIMTPQRPAWTVALAES